jgi:AcrR family transcriptional regulator
MSHHRGAIVAAASVQDSSLVHPMLDQTSSGPRERLLDAADELLNSASINGTGVDAIVRHSGAARKSLYRYFKSKDDLFSTVLQRRSERWIAWFESSTLAQGAVASDQLVGMFDILSNWLNGDGLNGCALLNAAAEVRDTCRDIKLVTRAHNARLLEFVEGLCVASGAMDTRSLARQLLVLLDGAITLAMVEGTAGAALDAKEAARALLAGAA